jgi:hypothetical protein
VSELHARYAAKALLGMTSWTYKWFDPARDDADELSETLMKLVLQRGAAAAAMVDAARLTVEGAGDPDAQTMREPPASRFGRFDPGREGM